MGTYQRFISNGVQPKPPPFSTRHLIWLNYKVVSQLFQLIYLAFSYLNIVRHFPGTELCRDNFISLFSTVLEKINLHFFAMDFLAFFNNAHFNIYFSWELTILWLTTYSLVIHQKQIIAFQPFQHLIIIHNVFLPHPQVY